jgi:hypothetical protein
MNYRPAAIGLLLLVASSLQAQWTEPDTTSLATTDKVAIGSSTAPTKQLEVVGEASFSTFLTAGEIVIPTPAATAKGRLHSSIGNWVALTLNSRVSPAWNLDNTSLPGWAAKLDGRTGYDQFAIMRIPAGANPHTDEKVLFQVQGDGRVGIGLNIGTVATERLHLYENADVRTLLNIHNPFVGINSAAGIRTSSDVASMQLYTNSTARTHTRWGVTLGGWTEMNAVTGNGLAAGTMNATPLVLGTNSTSRMYFNPTGNIGVNTNAPSEGLHLLNKNLMLQATEPGGVTYMTIAAQGSYNGPYMYRWATAGSAGAYGIYPNSIEMYEYSDRPSDPSGCCKLRMQIRPAKDQAVWKTLIMDGTGNIGIGVVPNPSNALDVAGNGHFTGNLTVDGNLAARYQDVAEWVPATADLTPGTVVILNPEASNEVMASIRAYDTRVAGVVSAQPGIILGEAGAAKEQIATTGRVKVRVDASKGAIAVGDLLVTSDLSGTAMKSQPLDLGGVAIHRPGTIVGKALEPLAAGTAEILVLLSLQ